MPLRSNFAWTMAGNLVYAGCQWGILVVIAKLATPETVGQFAIGLAVTAPVFLLAGLNLRASQATDAGNRFRFRDYFGVRLGGMTAGLAATAAIASFSGYGRSTRLVVLAVGVSKAVEGMSDVHYGAFQQHERMRPIAVSLALRGILALAAVGTVMWLGGGLLLAVVALCAAWLAVLLVHDRRAAMPLVRASPTADGRRVDWRAAGSIVAICLPLGLVMMALSLRTNVPRYFIEVRSGAGELGIFAALSSLLVAGNMVVQALGQSASPRLARHFHEGDVRAFRRLLVRLVALAVFLGLAGLVLSVVAGKPLLRVLFGPRYAGRADVLAWLMAAGLVSYTGSFLGFALTATRHFTVQLPVFVAATALCAGACWWLVPAYGVLGAAWSWGASLLFEVIVVSIVLERALRRSSGRAAS